MKIREFAGQLKDEIVKMREAGIETIDSDRLIKYLNHVQSSAQSEPTAFDLEVFKADIQSAGDTAKHLNEVSMEMHRATISAGANASRSSFLLTGGGAVALLAFIGQIAGSHPDRVPAFAHCLLPFALGVLATAMTAGSTYAAQWFWAERWPKTSYLGNLFNIVAVALGIASYAGFVWGIYETYRVLLVYAP
jgi:hypothetical protein